MSIFVNILIRHMNVFTPLNPACSVPPCVLAYAMLNSGVSPHKQRTGTDLTNQLDWSVVMALALAGCLRSAHAYQSLLGFLAECCLAQIMIFPEAHLG